jgi:hypothetical protein
MVKPDKVSKIERKKNLFDRSDLRIRFYFIMEMNYNRVMLFLHFFTTMQQYKWKSSGVSLPNLKPSTVYPCAGGKNFCSLNFHLFHIVRWFILQFESNFKIYGFVKSIFSRPTKGYLKSNDLS